MPMNKQRNNILHKSLNKSKSSSIKPTDKKKRKSASKPKPSSKPKKPNSKPKLKRISKSDKLKTKSDQLKTKTKKMITKKTYKKKIMYGGTNIINASVGVITSMVDLGKSIFTEIGAITSIGSDMSRAVSRPSSIPSAQDPPTTFEEADLDSIKKR